MTLSTKLRLFQYKITQRCLVTNIKLFYYKIKETKLCTFCNQKDENIMHLFWDCIFVQWFWYDFFDMLKYDFDDNRLVGRSNTNATRILLNVVIKNPLDYINTLVLVAKRHIYVSRCNNVRPNINVFVNNMLKLIETEKYIVLHKGKIEVHKKKWEKVTLI